MIISNTHRFVFVHIPKCAGTSVRNLLRPFDDTGEKYRPNVSEHPQYGHLDFTHLPLALLKQIAPEDFQKLKEFTAMAIVRDPRERFFSALAQRAKMYEGTEIAQMSSTQTQRLTDDVIAALRDPAQKHAPDLVHFLPQSEFVFFEGQKLVDEIYPITQVSALIARVSALTGTALSLSKPQNRTTVFRSSGAQSLAMGGKKLAEALLPASAAQPLKKAARKILMKPAQHMQQGYALAPELSDFVTEHYAHDFELYKQALSQEG